MYAATVAVVDASRARLFALERESDAGRLHESFSEIHDLVNPGRRMSDDHLDADFARRIVAEIERIVKVTDSPRLVVCASPNMLGELRKAFHTLHERVTITTLARDLVQCAAGDLRERLAQHRVLPQPPQRELGSAASAHGL